MELISERIRNEIPFFSAISPEEKIILPDIPFINEIVNGQLKPFPEYTLEELELLIFSFSYLRMDAKELTEEFIWKIGEKKEFVDRYLILERETFYWWKKELSSVPLRNELIKNLGEELSLIKACIRFKSLNINLMAEEGNLRLLRYTHENRKREE